MLTFETDGKGVLEVTFDEAGREELLRIIGAIGPDDHDHMATPAWGGWGLSEDFPNPHLIPIHQVALRWRANDAAGT